MHNRSGFCVHHPTATPIGNGDRHRLLHARLGDHVSPHTDRYTRTLCHVPRTSLTVKRCNKRARRFAV